MPVTGTFVGESSALLVTVSCAVAVPDALGANWTVTGTLCPTATVTGKVMPDRVNSELFDCAAVIVTGAPVAESAMTRDALEPNVTLPKSRLAGVTVKCAVAASTPTPCTVITNCGFRALLVIVTTPSFLPATVGANRIGILTLLPAPKVTGSGKLPKLKELPVMDLARIRNGFVPTFVN